MTAAALGQTDPHSLPVPPSVAVAGHEAGRRAGSSADWHFAPAAAALEGSAIREILQVTEQAAVLSFAGGLPNPAAFPVEALRAATARVLADDASAALQYGPTEGYGPLRELVAARLSAAGQPTTPAEVLITTGSQQALDLIGKAFLAPGGALLARNPTYLGALQAFALQTPRVLDLEAWIDAGIRRAPQPGGGPAFCYLTPNFANPDGATMPTDARRALLARLDNAGVPLVEDDPYGELWSDAPPPPACRALVPQRTLYLGSFSKVLAPGLRVGYVAGPRPAVELLTRLKQAADLHTPSLNQRIVAALIEDGTLDRHLPAVRAIYRTQRVALLAARTATFPGSRPGRRQRAACSPGRRYVPIPDSSRTVSLKASTTLHLPDSKLAPARGKTSRESSLWVSQRWPETTVQRRHGARVSALPAWIVRIRPPQSDARGESIRGAGTAASVRCLNAMRKPPRVPVALMMYSFP
ncbi:PLP-dependent aminotransferase family protein [Candidatus Accumulibacter vicinus]|uniref:2-aminoadipate transaminase n=1 Tax=Candidatus Accumulibacter vicinus TaxID=2954382 RepID=A0A084XVI6_9PROT|nr:PLP-dependent aminotransferase family protein [Candidatus Accumulibacter vicinus]KFB66480.1 MAG: 2-aminoadipate transaminase [Candidatus Accumulibacter vicinus]